VQVIVAFHSTTNTRSHSRVLTCSATSPFSLTILDVHRGPSTTSRRTSTSDSRCSGCVLVPLKVCRPSTSGWRGGATGWSSDLPLGGRGFDFQSWDDWESCSHPSTPVLKSILCYRSSSTLAASSRKHNVSVWRPSVSLSRLCLTLIGRAAFFSNVTTARGA